MELNKTARVALEANLDFYNDTLDQLNQGRQRRLDALKQIEKEIAVVEGHISDLKEVLGNDERDYSEGVE